MKILALTLFALLILLSLGALLLLVSAVVSKVRKAKSGRRNASGISKGGTGTVIPFNTLAEYHGGLKKSSNEELRRLFEKGLSFKRKRKFPEAIGIFERCLEATLTPDQKSGIMITTGNCYFSLDKLDLAKSYYEMADGFSRESDNSTGRLSCLVNLGLACAADHNWDDAIRNYDEAIDLDKKLGYTAGEAIDLNTLALLYENKGDFEKALTHYTASLQIFERLNDGKKAKLVGDNIRRVRTLSAESGA
ncbi:MAG: tetratricopeptide repeat protein [candidate division Zixibacteria bacterium]|nr:tetratricopeptide repeat protein [candidate division Zixibacteria bacterium]